MMREISLVLPPYPPARCTKDDPEISAWLRGGGQPPDYDSFGLVKYHYLASEDDTAGDYGLYRVELAPKADITKTVKWMVSATPDATDSRHTTARKLGIPIISPAEGSVRLDEAVRAELKAFERQREINRHTALRQQRADEADAYWRPSWRPEELDHRSRTRTPVRMTALFSRR
jgi:hypothetical protein